jgi:hypothetical protein
MIQHVGTFDAENLGDRLYPILFRRLAGLETRIFGVTARAMPEYSCAEAEQLSEAHPVLIGGGDLLLHESHPMGCMKLSRWPTVFRHGFCLRWPAIYLSIGVPFRNEQKHHAKFLWVRDFRAAGNLAHDVPDAVAPDLAVLSALTFPSRKKDSSDQPIAFVQTAYPGRGMGKVLQQLSAAYDVRLLSITHYNGDFEAMVPLARETRLPLLRVDRADELPEILSLASLIVASSLHANVIAFSYGIPHLFAPAPAMNKIPGFLEIVGLPKEVALQTWEHFDPRIAVADGHLRVRAQDAARKALDLALAALE